MYHDFNYVGYEQRRQKPQQRKPRYSVNHAAVGDDRKLYRSISIEANMNDQVTADTHKASKKDNHVGRRKKFESIQLRSSRRPKSLESQDLFLLPDIIVKPSRQNRHEKKDYRGKPQPHISMTMNKESFRQKETRCNPKSGKALSK